MPGLTLNTEGAAPPTVTPIYPPANFTTSQPPAHPPGANPQQQHQTPPRPSSPPQRPTYSPITPPLNPVALPPPPPPPRAAYTHASQRPQTSVAPPPPEPIDFDANPDVLALRSAISVLQIQRRRAEADMGALSRAKAAALAEPEAFVRDLASGRVAVEGDGLFGGDSSSSSSEEDEDMEEAAVKPDPDASSARPWTRLPKPQSIVRCPPVNWSQYAVVGESLDKLHAEQQSRPSQGVPAQLAPDGRYEFNGVGRQERLVGVAAPYAPGKDRIDRRPKGLKR
ncbi:hypothetical protein F4804DRAFT_144025 [Jackrogersella minutella]|nr:hypothetical protein F4804DRAFT_144025 [Jackrogersella minutella]